MTYNFTSPKDIKRTSTLRQAIRATFPIALEESKKISGWKDALYVDFIWVIRGGRKRYGLTLGIPLEEASVESAARIIGSATATMETLGVSGHPLRVRVVRNVENTESGQSVRRHGLKETDRMLIIAGQDSMLSGYHEVKGIGIREPKTKDRRVKGRAELFLVKESEANEEVINSAISICENFWNSYMETYSNIRAVGGNAVFVEEARERPEEIISFVMDSSLELIN